MFISLYSLISMPALCNYLVPKPRNPKPLSKCFLGKATRKGHNVAQSDWDGKSPHSTLVSFQGV